MLEGGLSIETIHGYISYLTVVITQTVHFR
jgi:hypothetical protein